MSSGSTSSEPDVIWEASPWVTPQFVALTAGAILLAVALSYVELAWLGVDPSILGVTFLFVGMLWLVGAVKIELVAWSNRYSLRSSSLELEHGIVWKETTTVSAAGFSDLTLTRSLLGRILNTGDIVIETDSRRDLALLRVRDPTRVSTLIRQVMTVPLVRLEREGQLQAAGGAIPT